MNSLQLLPFTKLISMAPKRILIQVIWLNQVLIPISDREKVRNTFIYLAEPTGPIEDDPDLTEK